MERLEYSGTGTTELTTHDGTWRLVASAGRYVVTTPDAPWNRAPLRDRRPLHWRTGPTYTRPE